MTRLGLISDVHANRVALEAVLADLPSVDGLVCAGDVVGYNPWPGACVEALRDRDVATVQGNHDRAVASGVIPRVNELAAAGMRYARRALDDDQVAWLGSLPVERTVAGGRVKVVHGHPEDPDRYTRREDVNADLLGGEAVLVLGHTHVQFTAHLDDGVVLNPGSVGQPRDGDPRAAYAVIDLDDLAVEERRVAYDVDAVQRAVEAAGLPDRTAERLVHGQ